MKRTCRGFFFIPAIMVILLGLIIPNQSSLVFAEDETGVDSLIETPTPLEQQSMPGDTTDSKLLVSDESDDGFLSEFLNFIIGQ